MGNRAAFPFSAACLFAAVAVYGILGSPTPDRLGPVEMVIGALLVLGCGAAALDRSADLQIGLPPFMKAMQALFLAGLILPLATGVVYGNDRMLIIRDVLAFFFTCLPVFAYHVFEGRERAVRWLPYLLCFSGTVFALRTLMPAFNVWIPGGELLYLSNSPMTLFAAIWLSGLLWRRLCSPSMASVPQVAGMLAVLAMILAAMLLDVQRATVGAVFIALAIHFMLTFVKTPKRALIGAALVLVILGAVYPLIADSASALARKTASVGFNMRQQEAQAVLQALSASPLTLMLGVGWGGVLASPAVGMLDVNFTHSFLTTMLLKGGVVLLFLAVMACAAALYQIYGIMRHDAVRGLALLPPFLIPVLLYASHKSLDFGLILLLIGVWSIARGGLQAAGRSCIEKEHQEQDRPAR